MRIAYFDCFAGISGDMVLGAVLDAGADEARFRQELARLAIEFELQVSKVVKNGIEATDVRVIVPHEHHHRRLNDIKALIESSDLSQTVKTRSTAIFQRLAEAEGAVHGTSPEEVTFHEVGAVDAIVDIVGSAIGMELLGIEEVFCSPLPMGHGFVEAAHGKIPLPAPATVEILKCVPVYDAGIQGELVTPTGAAIIRTLATEFGDMSPMTLQATAYGAGKTEFPFPNVLRLMIGESDGLYHERVAIVETNIDDMNPEFYDTVFERLFKAGALDVYLTPIYMKKNRPANLLTAICPIEKKDDISQVILTETTTFGVRISIASRRCLERRWETVTTRFGDIRIKIGLMGDKQITAS
ncbi:MAG TPA: nickel pincer cofactor biosynthesis protein LarC, partial [Armatimonadota bacterium]|nr:nickel pincer cofactor biosynthesis protein LarC [Armatimonadota bacterium]